MPIEVPATPNPVVDAIDDLDPDELSPRQALEALYRLKKLRGRGLASAVETSERHNDDFFRQYDQNHEDDRAILADQALKQSEMDRLFTLPGVKEACRAIPNFRFPSA